MILDFDKMETTSIPNFKNGTGVTEARMYNDSSMRILLSRIKPNSSIGVHTHDNSAEVMIFVSGEGKAICDGKEEPVRGGLTHYCPRGSTHTLINTGSEDLVVYCVVAQY